MRLHNHIYKDLATLNDFIETNGLVEGNSLLIQIFSSNTEDAKPFQVAAEIKNILPQSAIIGSSTAGIIQNAEIMDSEVVLSFSLFEHSSVKSQSYQGLSVEEVAYQLENELITPRTKLLLFFSNTFSFDAEKLLIHLGKTHPSLIVAGGNGADDFKLKSCSVFCDLAQGCDVAFAAIDSDILQVGTDSLFNWHTIGRELTITKMEETHLYELENRPVMDVYEHYLGKEVVDNILQRGTEFPLVSDKGGIKVARGPIFAHEDRTLTLAARFSEGEKVKFAYADIREIDDYNQTEFLKRYDYKMEGIYIYSCSGRRSMLRAYLNKEIAMINEIAPTTGFIAYGEFFHSTHNSTNALLNFTTTFVTLSEKKPSLHLKAPIEKKTEKKTDHDLTLKALTTLISKTGKELDTNISHLKQFNHNLEKQVQLEVAKNIEQKSMLEQQSKMAEMGEMISAIAHQLKQPLNAIALSAQIAELDLLDGAKENVVEHLHKIYDQCHFMSATIDEFRNYFKRDSKASLFNIKDSIISIEHILDHQLKTHGITLKLDDVDATLTYTSYPNAFKQIILNLINNAKDAIKENGIKEGTIEVSCQKEEHTIRIEVQDNGGGIPEAIKAKIFEPYFTTKELDGTGIGLSIIKSIVEEKMHGSIAVENIGKGARFSIHLPLT